MYGLKNLDVLVVDDHTHMRHIWTHVLNGFAIKNVVRSSNAADALDYLKDHNIDIAIIDMIMGDVSGEALIKYLRQNDASPNPTLPIIVCTADTRKSAIYRIINSGADEILTKPITPTAVWQRLVSVINHRRQFIMTPNYFGPDRRRVNDPSYKGPDRRESLFL